MGVRILISTVIKSVLATVIGKENLNKVGRGLKNGVARTADGLKHGASSTVGAVRGLKDHLATTNRWVEAIAIDSPTSLAHPRLLSLLLRPKGYCCNAFTADA